MQVGRISRLFSPTYHTYVLFFFQILYYYKRITDKHVYIYIYIYEYQDFPLTPLDTYDGAGLELSMT